ncbi:MAG: hypothetical protein Q7J54_05275 [Candidatus Woesearchaeota archaeon]|nr:hypothetical protein [Candidatus Woesearchaeota archaeon]
MKKAQITIYITLGIVLLVGVAFFIYSYYSSIEEKLEAKSEETRQLSPQERAIKEYVESCLGLVGKGALVEIGFGGGYLDPPFYASNFFFDIAYLYYDDLVIVPSKEEVGKEISKYIDRSIDGCINFSFLADLGYNVTRGNIKANTAILENKAIITLNYPLKFQRHDSTFTVSEFSASHNVRLGHILDIVDDIVGDELDHPEWIDVEKLSSYDVDVSIRGKYLDTIAYFMIDNQSKIDNSPYIFVFATQFNTTKYFLPENNAPQFKDLKKEFNISAGKGFLYKVEAYDLENDTITFESETTMFNINAVTGIISFTPAEIDKGLRLVPVYIADSKGTVNYALLRFNIK